MIFIIEIISLYDVYLYIYLFIFFFYETVSIHFSLRKKSFEFQINDTQVKPDRIPGQEKENPLNYDLSYIICMKLFLFISC